MRGHVLFVNSIASCTKKSRKNIQSIEIYYVEKRNGILRKNRGKGFEKNYVPLHGGRRGGQNCQNNPYVIKEWYLNYTQRSERVTTSIY